MTRQGIWEGFAELSELATRLARLRGDPADDVEIDTMVRRLINAIQSTVPVNLQGGGFRIERNPDTGSLELWMRVGWNQLLGEEGRFAGWTR